MLKTKPPAKQDFKEVSKSFSLTDIMDLSQKIGDGWLESETENRGSPTKKEKSGKKEGK